MPKYHSFVNISSYLALQRATFKIPNTRAKLLIPVGIYVPTYCIMQAFDLNAMQIKNLLQCPLQKNGPTCTQIRNLTISKLVALKNAMNIEPIIKSEQKQANDDEDNDAIMQTVNALLSMEHMPNVFDPIDDNHHHYEQHETTAHLSQGWQQWDNGYPRTSHHHRHDVHQCMNNFNIPPPILPLPQLQTINNNLSIPPPLLPSSTRYNPLSAFISNTNNRLPIFEPMTMPQNNAPPPTIIILNVQNGYNGNYNANSHVSGK